MNVVTNQNTFNEQWAALWEKQASAVTGNDQQKKAWQAFATAELPNTRHEEWKYTKLDNLYKLQFTAQQPSQLSDSQLAAFQIPDLEAYRLVFVNGIYRDDLSNAHQLPSGVQLVPLAQALQNDPALAQNYFAKHLATTQEPFTALNTALFDHGICLQVAARTQVEKPILLHYLADSQAGNAVTYHTHNILVAERNSQVAIIEKYDAIGSAHSFATAVTEVFVQENAEVSHYKIQLENPQAYHIGTTLVHQKRDSRFTNFTLTFDGAVIRNNLHLLLDGENIEGNMYGLFLVKGSTVVDNHTAVDHLKPNSVSNELYKGVVDEKASGVFNGKIYVRQDAQKTNAYQQSRSVLLSENATVNTKPQLEIWADDVKCSHGATTGSVDKEAMFYLQSRGIPEAEARALLVYAFANDVVEKIPIAPLQAYCNGLIQQRLAAQIAL